jgi:hypothetical protein
MLQTKCNVKVPCKYLYSMMHFITTINICLAESLTETLDKRKTMLQVKIVCRDI